MEVGERYDLINSETGEIVDIKSMLKTKGKSKVNKTNRSTSVKLFKKNGIATSVKASSIVKYVESMKRGE